MPRRVFSRWTGGGETLRSERDEASSLIAVPLIVFALAVALLPATADAATGQVAAPAATPAPVTVPDGTVNPFLPEDRAISECISAVPKPGCGSDERGGWHQYLVAVAMVGGLLVVGSRIAIGVRRGRRRAVPG